MLFGKRLNYDCEEFYLTCARARTCAQHRESKSFSLEHTKPIFNENKILAIKKSTSIPHFYGDTKSIEVLHPDIRVVATTPEKTHNQKFLTFETILNRFLVQF